MALNVMQPALDQLPDTLEFERDPSENDTHLSFLRTLIRQIPVGHRVTDIHLREGEAPVLVINDRIVRTSAGPISRALLDSLFSAFTDHAKSKFETDFDADGRVDLDDGSLLRVHGMRHSGGRAFTIRLQPPVPYTWAQMGLPDDLLEVLDRDQGLVIFTGPVGSRKTSAMHAMLDHVNRHHAPKHILTIEDPPEFAHAPLNALFTVREIGHTTPNYETALMGALRVRPNIVVVGEARDRATIEAAILASKLGRLALTSMHAETATEVPHRIQAAFPPGSRDEIFSALTETFVAIVALRCVPDTSGSMILAYEIVRNNAAVRGMIDDPIKLRGQIDNGTDVMRGMITMETCLQNFVRDGRISVDTALAYAPDRKTMSDLLGISL